MPEDDFRVKVYNDGDGFGDWSWQLSSPDGKRLESGGFHLTRRTAFRAAHKAARKRINRLRNKQQQYDAKLTVKS